MIPTRILFVDDHKLFRESVVRLLDHESDFTIVAQCGTLSEAERILKTNLIDLVLLDYDLGAEVGTALLPSLMRAHQGIRILMVTGGMGSTAIHAAIDAGVSGILLKHSDPERLIAAIRRVASGETWWDMGVLRSLGNDVKQTSAPASNRVITDRQRQVLQLILDGYTNKEIAVKIDVSEAAVKASIQELFNKASVRTRSQLVRIAIEKHASDWLKTP